MYTASYYFMTTPSSVCTALQRKICVFTKVVSVERCRVASRLRKLIMCCEVDVIVRLQTQYSFSKCKSFIIYEYWWSDVIRKQNVVLSFFYPVFPGARQTSDAITRPSLNYITLYRRVSIFYYFINSCKLYNLQKFIYWVTDPYILLVYSIKLSKFSYKSSRNKPVWNNNIILRYEVSRQHGVEWGEGAQLARCCRRVEFGTIAN